MHLENQVFGRLIVLEKDTNKGDVNHPYWICKCECGTIKSVRQDILRNGSVRSCGCLAKELSSKRIIENGLPGHNFIDLTGKRFGKLVVLNLEKKEYNEENRRSSILYRCKCDCGNESFVYAENLRTLHTTSCGCRKDSYGTTILKKILNNLNIKYETEKIFPDCKSNKNGFLRMDFYLPNYNTVIEIDGQQHFYTEPTGYFTQESLDRMKHLDKIKNNYCKDKGIRLIRIPYTEWKKLNIEYIQELLN